MKKHSIIYIGKIEQLTLDLEQLKASLNCNIQDLEYGQNYEALFKKILKLLPRLILIEVRHVNSDFLSFLLLLKSHTKIGQSRIIAIFPDKNNLEQYCDIYSFGVEYGLIFGEEEKKIASDLSIFLDSSKNSPQQYAQAKNLHIPTEIKFPAKISHLTAEKMGVESFLPLSNDEQVEASFFWEEDIKLKFFKVEDSNNFLPRSFFSNSAEFKILFDGDKDLDSEVIGGLCDKKSFPSFLQKIKPKSYPRNDPALIIDNRAETLADLIHELNVNNRFIKISNRCYDFLDKLAVFSPKIICYQMERESNDMADDDLMRVNGASVFNQLIEKIKEIADYNPYVLVFNERSRSQAYRKAHSYENIIVNRKSFELSYLSMIIDEYQRNHPVNDSVYYLKPPDKLTRIEIDDHITITSIAENILTFLSDRPLNFYTTFKIAAPLNIYVTVIPSNQELESKGTQRHYLGLISNTNEKDKMEIRKLVNLLIKLELKEGETFTLKSVKELREDIINSKLSELEAMRKTQKEVYDEKDPEQDET